MGAGGWRIGRSSPQGRAQVLIHLCLRSPRPAEGDRLGDRLIYRPPGGAQRGKLRGVLAEAKRSHHCSRAAKPELLRTSVTPPMPDPETLIVDTIRTLLARRDGDIPVTLDSNLHADLDLDSLELAELSAILEDDLGRDPYTAGVVPRTVGDIVGFYN